MNCEAPIGMFAPAQHTRRAHGGKMQLLGTTARTLEVPGANHQAQPRRILNGKVYEQHSSPARQHHASTHDLDPSACSTCSLESDGGGRRS